MYYNPYQQIYPQQQTVQDGGFVPAPNEAFARAYPVAQGKSVTFKDENAPYIYTKTVGVSQLDHPIFEKFRLVKEEAEEKPEYDVKSEIDRLWLAIEDITSAKKTATRRKSDGGDD